MAERASCDLLVYYDRGQLDPEHWCGQFRVATKPTSGSARRLVEAATWSPSARAASLEDSTTGGITHNNATTRKLCGSCLTGEEAGSAWLAGPRSLFGLRLERVQASADPGAGAVEQRRRSGVRSSVDVPMIFASSKTDTPGRSALQANVELMS